MDTTTVQEIANQLGIAINQIMDYLPAYANVQWWGNLIPLIVIMLVFVLSSIGVVFCKIKYLKWDDVYLNTRYSVDSSNSKLCHKAIHFSELYDHAFIIFSIITGISLFFLIFGLCTVPSILMGWSEAPELMLLKSLV